MRTGAAAGHIGFFHETAFYASNDEFLSIVIPFLQDGVAANEPTLVTLVDDNANLVRSVLGEPDGITFVSSRERYQSPAMAIRVYAAEFARQHAAGATQIRVVGDVPHPGHGLPWDSWVRYEAAINHAYNEFPLWGMCPYDTRITPDFVVDEIIRTHQHIAASDGSHTANPAYNDPSTFLAERVPVASLNMPGPPVLDLDNPDPRTARRAVDELVRRTQLSAEEIDGLELAVTEIVTNAMLYGSPPVSVRAWISSPRRVMVIVSDSGSGIADPFAGLLPQPATAPGGRGLWIAQQSCADVGFHYHNEGFSVALAAGDIAQ